MRISYFKIFFLLGIVFTSHAQNNKELIATRITNAPKIDGVLDDEVWKSLPKYGNFNMYEPGNEGDITEAYQSEIQMGYDDKAVYFAAYLYHPNPTSIAQQFSQRDEIFVQADHFAIALNTYNDGINETRFFITSAGTIGDARVVQDDFDFSFNVVFNAKISMDEKGWYTEFKIPYNALRFPEIEVQNWSVNFYRRLTNKNETHTWNFIENSIGVETQYNAPIKGVSKIDPPTRLLFFPFVQGLTTSLDGETETSFSAGLDAKYGLSDSFTLDATLIPDFGQVGFDAVELNLGPFEQTFQEQRQFFIEGVELFNKGNIFFSRRIGNEPTGNAEDALQENEEVAASPNNVNLLNALKVSGRTKGNLGIGVLNAITERTFATVRDTLTGTTREVAIEPLANYNVITLDQQFNQNSSVSLVNTNVLREGSFRDANTTALAFDIANKKNTYRTSGRAIVSNLMNPEGTTTGFRSEFDFFKTQGKFRYRFGHDFADKSYDINDLGLNFRNNFNSFTVGASYEIFEPTKVFNRYRFSLTARHRRLYEPNVLTSNNLNLNWFFVTTERFAFGGFLGYNSDNDDYFEPRMDGQFVIFPKNLGGRIWASSDYRKKFAYDIGIGHRQSFGEPIKSYFMDFSPRYRFSDKLLVVWSTDFSLRNNNFGYIDDDGTNVFLGRRDITSIENNITASFNFDPYKAIDLRFRNFWSSADYSEDIFWILNDDGSRTRIIYDVEANDPNVNFNIWNLDLRFRWRFAPGSFVTFLYRNQIFNQDEQATLSYLESLDNLWSQPIQHSLSLRVTYFLDYNNLKTLF